MLNPSAEYERLIGMTTYERDVRAKGYQIIAGVDEAGRGPLAGPVVAAACILPPDYLIPGVNDSKQVTPNKREELFEQLTNDPNVIYGVHFVESTTIDRINIYQATIKAMQGALKKLHTRPEYVLMDGMTFLHPHFEILKIVKGDEKSLSIAAASILAKVSRDRWMKKYHKKWPQYGFDQHKGYGTEAHLEAIASHGPCPIHRMSFEPFKTLHQGSLQESLSL